MPQHPIHLAKPLVTLLYTVVLLLVTAAVGAPVARADGADPVPLRIATYNIHHGAGPDNVLDLRHVMKTIASTHADVVGLQEIDKHFGERSNFVDQASWIARELGMHVVYGANLDYDPLHPGQERRQYGTAILSRYPIKSWSNTYLPKFENGEQRGLLVANLSVHGVPVRVANTHLQFDNNLEREAQVARIVELLGDSPTRTVLTGDLNATPDAPEIKTLTDVFADVWAEVGVGDGFTQHLVGEAPRRIDYVLASHDVLIRRARVLTSDASDHLPVVAQLAVRR